MQVSSPFSVVCGENLALDKLNFKEEVIRLAEARVMFRCDGCDDDMCIGDRFYHIGLRRLCEDCLKEYALEYFAAALELVE